MVRKMYFELNKCSRGILGTGLVDTNVMSNVAIIIGLIVWYRFCM